METKEAILEMFFNEKTLIDRKYFIQEVVKAIQEMDKEIEEMEGD